MKQLTKKKLEELNAELEEMFGIEDKVTFTDDTYQNFLFNFGQIDDTEDYYISFNDLLDTRTLIDVALYLVPFFKKALKANVYVFESYIYELDDDNQISEILFEFDDYTKIFKKTEVETEPEAETN